MPFRGTVADDHGMALWRRYCNLPADQKRDTARISRFAHERGLTNAEVGLGTAGRFRHFECVVVKALDVDILLPCEHPDVLLGEWTESLLGAADFLGKVEWFHPAYMSKRFVAAVEQVVHATGQDWQDAFETVLSLAYTPDYIATMVSDRYRAIPATNAQIELIEEAVETFYVGFRLAAVGSLIPAVEGALSGMLQAFRSRQDQTGAELVQQVIAAAIDAAAGEVVHQGAWIPREYRARSFLSSADEYVEMLEVFERFCLRTFFAKTAEYAGVTGLNRHGVLHAVSGGYGTTANFCRLISILDLIAFIGSMNVEGVSCLAPNDTAASRALAARYVALTLLGQSYRRSVRGSAAE